MNHPALLWYPRARSSDPDTSHVAADRVVEFESAHYRAILGALQTGGGTIYEIAARANLDHVAVARRCGELEGINLIKLTGEKRPSPRGRPCRVWCIVKDGEA